MYRMFPSKLRQKKSSLRTNRINVMSGKRKSKDLFHSEKCYTDKTAFKKPLTDKQCCRFYYDSAHKKIGICVLIACLAISAYQIFDRVKLYRSSPTTTEMRIIGATSKDVPKFLLCPVPDFRNHPIMKKMKLKLASQFPNRSFELLTIAYLNVSYLWEKVNITENRIQTFVKMNQEKNFYKQQSPTEIIQIPTYKGTCLDIILNETVISRFFKLRIETAKRLYYNSSQEDRIDYKLFPHDTNIGIRHLPYFKEGINVLQDSETDLKIGIKKLNSIPSAKNPCVSNAEVNEYWENCIDNEINKRVSCRLPFFKNSSLPYCSNPSTFSKAFREAIIVYYLYVNGSNCQTPLFCDETVYTTYVMSLNVIRGQRVSVLIISIKDHNIEVITEYYNYNFVALFSDIGGSLGLFLGFSICSLFNEFLSYILRMYLRLKTKKILF